MTQTSKKRRDTINRTGRTATQAGWPSAVVALLAAFDIIHWSPEQTAAVLFVAIPFGAFVQNWLENRYGVAFLFAKATPDPEPTQPPDEGAVVPDLIIDESEEEVLPDDDEPYLPEPEDESESVSKSVPAPKPPVRVRKKGKRKGNKKRR